MVEPGCPRFLGGVPRLRRSGVVGGALFTRCDAELALLRLPSSLRGVCCRYLVRRGVVRHTPDGIINQRNRPAADRRSELTAIAHRARSGCCSRPVRAGQTSPSRSAHQTSVPRRPLSGCCLTAAARLTFGDGEALAISRLSRAGSLSKGTTLPRLLSVHCQTHQH